MCLTIDALALFLSLLDPAIISSDVGAITIHATEREAVWVQLGTDWCTTAKLDDRLARFDPVKKP